MNTSSSKWKRWAGRGSANSACATEKSSRRKPGSRTRSSTAKYSNASDEMYHPKSEMHKRHQPESGRTGVPRAKTANKGRRAEAAKAPAGRISVEYLTDAFKLLARLPKDTDCYQPEDGEL